MKELSEETKEKMRNAKLGKKRPNMMGANNHNFGKDFSGSRNPGWKGGFSKAQKSKRHKEKHPETVRFDGMKRRAKEKSLEFNITLEEFREWLKSKDQTCEYCKREVIINSGDRMGSLSIDRKDNELGYILNNLCISCNRCNTVKGNFFTYEQMKEIAEKYFCSNLPNEKSI